MHESKSMIPVEPMIRMQIQAPPRNLSLKSTRGPNRSCMESLKTYLLTVEISETVSMSGTLYFYSLFPANQLLVILIAIDVARRDAQNELKEGEKHPEKIIVLPEHINLVVENRNVFARSYRAATGYDTDVMAANNNFRSVKGGKSILTDA